MEQDLQFYYIYLLNIQKQIISLSGLDPIERSSGTSLNKKARISKSGARVYRGTLFMGVLTAIRYDKSFYLKASGLQDEVQIEY